MKKLFAILLTLALMLSMSTTAFATENDTSANGIPEYATKHTIELTLEPGSEMNTVAPCVWGDPSMTLIDNYSAYTSAFYLSDRYFAFEMQGFLENAPSGVYDVYAVALEHAGGGSIASSTGNADGSVYKHDWITIYTDGNYRFLITNPTNYHLTVYLVYYSYILNLS